MSVQFQRLVEIARSGRSAEVRGDSLRVTLAPTPQIKHLLEEVHEAGNAIRLFKDGREIYVDFLDLDEMVEISITVARVQGAVFHIAHGIEDFLSYQGGRFLVDPPANWYLVGENYSSGEAANSDAVAGYLRLPNLLDLLDKVSDFSTSREVTRLYVFLAGERYDLPVVCGIEQLSFVPTDEEVEALREDVFGKPRMLAKKELLKRAMVRHFKPVTELGRFSALLASFSSIATAYEAARDNFVSEFEFEKLSEKFERKREEYMLKIDSVCSDLLTKVIALPVAQALVVSQYKDGAGLANFALLFGSAMVAILGVAFISVQVHAIREIRKSALRERDEVRKNYPELYRRVQDSYGAVVFRLAVYGRFLPAAIGVLILASFLFSVSGYDQASPCSGCVSEMLSSMKHGSVRPGSS